LIEKVRCPVRVQNAKNRRRRSPPRAARFATRTAKRRVFDGVDLLWNSSTTVAHATRWDLNLPGSQWCVRLYGGGVDARTRYFYELSIRHEDMHVEALAYTRQTLGYARPDGLGHAADHDGGPWPGDPSVPARGLARPYPGGR
jgi:hypothetical protein